MRNKLYWGLGILIVLLIGAFVRVMVNQHAEIKQGEAELKEAQRKLETHNKVENTPEVVDISETKPPDEPGFKWVRHGNHWDKVPVTSHKNKVAKTPSDGKVDHDYYYDRVYKKYGVPPPPPGYGYRMSDPGVLRLDDNGNPILYKEGEPVFDVHKIPGFAPTREQYQYYKELIRKRDHERRTGNDAAADQFNAKIRQLKAEAQGVIPFVTSSLGIESHLYEAAKADQERKAGEIMKQAYIDMGLGHMVGH